MRAAPNGVRTIHECARAFDWSLRIFVVFSGIEIPRRITTTNTRWTLESTMERLGLERRRFEPEA